MREGIAEACEHPHCIGCEVCVGRLFDENGRYKYPMDAKRALEIGRLIAEGFAEGLRKAGEDQ